MRWAHIQSMPGRAEPRSLLLQCTLDENPWVSVQLGAVVSCSMLALPGLDSTLGSEQSSGRGHLFSLHCLRLQEEGHERYRIAFPVLPDRPHPPTGSVVSSDFLISFLQRRFCVQVQKVGLIDRYCQVPFLHLADVRACLFFKTATWSPVYVYCYFSFLFKTGTYHDAEASLELTSSHPVLRLQVCASTLGLFYF